jgi:hypothetical protein
MNPFGKFLSSFFKYFDGFGESHTFRVNKEKTYNTPVGGFFCVIFLVYACYYILWTFSDFMQGNDKTKEYDLKINLSPSINMTDHKYFNLAFCLRDEDMKIDEFLTENLDLTIYYKKSYLNSDKVLTSSKTPLALTNCGNYDFKNTALTQHQKQYWSIFNSLQINSCKCLDFDTNIKYTFSSTLEAIEKNYFGFELTIKDPYNKEMIQSINDHNNLNNPKLHIYFPEYSADLYNDEEPLQIKMHTESFLLIPSQTQVANIYFGLLTFTDYFSYTSEEKYSQKNKLIFDNKDLYAKNSFTDNSILNVNFILSGNNITYKRYYLILQNYLANTLSYLWNICILLYLVAWAYNNFGSKRFLSERFFIRNSKFKQMIKKELNKGGVYTSKKLKRAKRTLSGKRTISIQKEIEPSDDKKEVLIEMDSKNKSLDMQSNDQSRDINNSVIDNRYNNKVNISLEEVSHRESDNREHIESKENIKEKDIISVDIPLKNEEELRKNNFKIFFWDYLVGGLFQACKCQRKTKKYELYKSTENFYNYYMDINNYLKVMVEFEIIKSIVLSKAHKSMLSKFKPYLKGNYQSLYKDKLQNLYQQTFNKDEIKKILTGIKTARNNSQKRTLKSLAQFI